MLSVGAFLTDTFANRGQAYLGKTRPSCLKGDTGVKAKVQDGQLSMEICFEVLHLILLVCTHLT